MSMWGKVVRKRAAAAVVSSSFATGTLSSALGLTGRQEDESDGEEVLPDLGDISEEDSEDSEGGLTCGLRGRDRTYLQT